MLDVWLQRGPGLESLPSLEGKHVVRVIRDLLGKCADQSPSPTTSGLTFITDPALRDSLRLDVGEVNRALHSGEWKAATVLAGSVVEALLLWALDDYERRTAGVVAQAVTNAMNTGMLQRRPKGSCDSWGLHELIEVAADLKVITTSTAKQARLAKNFRDLIHPGRAQRLGQICSRATAMSAIAALEHVTDDLTA